MICGACNFFNLLPFIHCLNGVNCLPPCTDISNAYSEYVTLRNANTVPHESPRIFCRKTSCSSVYFALVLHLTSLQTTLQTVGRQKSADHIQDHCCQPVRCHAQKTSGCWLHTSRRLLPSSMLNDNQHPPVRFDSQFSTLFRVSGDGEGELPVCALPCRSTEFSRCENRQFGCTVACSCSFTSTKRQQEITGAPGFA